MNIKGIIAAFDSALTGIGYAKDLTREGTAAPANTKAYRLVVEAFATAVETMAAPEFNSCDATITVILSRQGYGGRPEDATVDLAEQAETLASQLTNWFDLNYQNTIRANFIEARAYIGEAKTIKMGVSFEVRYDFSQN